VYILLLPPPKEGDFVLLNLFDSLTDCRWWCEQRSKKP